MTDPTPNPKQEALIENTEGLYLVDAGPGTGKTFAITRRYSTIIDQPDVEPEDVLLVTFTRSAATEMKERIVDTSDYGLRELADAPIQTFHAHCHDLLIEHGYHAPAQLDLEGRITGSTQVIDDDLLERELFDEFFSQFRSTHPEYADFYRSISTPQALLDLIGELAAKGIIPTAEGWYRDSGTHLDGDFELFKDQFDAVNEPRNGGRKQSQLRDDLSDFGKHKTYRPDAPTKTALRGSRGTKQLDDAVAADVFHEDREALKQFVHDVYVEYMQFALDRNYLTFGFLQVFAFVLLCENPRIREQARFEYVMIDEFQDTSEIQFKLALLLAGTRNFCVVGDWKQSIYSFQYAAVENILSFEDRLRTFAEALNNDTQRVAFEPTAPTRIELQENYRSTETIINLSEEALMTPATSGEDVATTRADIVELSSNAGFDNTVVEGLHGEDEHEAVLGTIQEIVGNDDYAIEDEDGAPRAPEYRDIAVFTRTRDYGRELLDVAAEYDFPMAYDGGIELFRTDPAKLLLAWLRILDTDADRGWVVVLERAGYTLTEIDRILETEAYPTEPAAFRDELRSLASVGAVARRIFDRYGFRGDTTDALLHTIQSLHDSTTLTRGEVIQLIERGIETGTSVEIHASASTNSVTVQTIHAAKGLEYPIVIMANMNAGRFPPRSRETSAIQYHESVGLRQRKVYAEDHGYPHVYDNWRFDVLRYCLPHGYDEERRLLYVAITRAEQHLFFVSGTDPNTFLEELPVTRTDFEGAPEPAAGTHHVETELPFAVAAPDGPIGHTPHSLMDDGVFEQTGEQMEPGVDADPETRGMDFGTRVHDFAEAYALEKNVTPSNTHEEHVVAFIDELPGELHVEEPVTLPIEVDGQQVTVSGIVDLVHETEETVDIVDYKTDSSRRAQSEYEKQVSVYYHVLAEWFAEKSVTTSIFYTQDGTREHVAPLSMDGLRDLIRQHSSALR